MPTSGIWITLGYVSKKDIESTFLVFFPCKLHVKKTSLQDTFAIEGNESAPLISARKININHTFVFML